MRRQLFQRCLFVLLLVSRLLFGEAAHAMPHEIAGSEAAAATHEQPCPEHSAGAAMHAAHMADVDTPNHKDCCGNGGCDCACMHLSALVTPALTVHLVIIDQLRLPASVAGPIQDRMSALFRPPA